MKNLANHSKNDGSNSDARSMGPDDDERHSHNGSIPDARAKCTDDDWFVTATSLL
jgi:hypothetical protein